MSYDIHLRKRYTPTNQSEWVRRRRHLLTNQGSCARGRVLGSLEVMNEPAQSKVHVIAHIQSCRRFILSTDRYVLCRPHYNGNVAHTQRKKCLFSFDSLVILSREKETSVRRLCSRNSDGKNGTSIDQFCQQRNC